MRTVFRDRKGNLTAYAFACGYVETRGRFRLSLQHGAYRVAGIDGAGVRHSVNVRTLTAGRKTLAKLAATYRMQEDGTHATEASAQGAVVSLAGPVSAGTPEPLRRFDRYRLRVVEVTTHDGARRTFTHADLSPDGASVRQIADATFAAFSDAAIVRVDGGLPYRR